MLYVFQVCFLDAYDYEHETLNEFQEALQQNAKQLYTEANIAFSWIQLLFIDTKWTVKCHWKDSSTTKCFQPVSLTKIFWDFEIGKFEPREQKM